MTHQGTNVQAGRDLLQKASADPPTLQAAEDLRNAAKRVVGGEGEFSNTGVDVYTRTSKMKSFSTANQRSAA